MTNPYTPPRTESAAESALRTNRLLCIWIWLPTAIFGAMLATPADILEIAKAMAFALPCFFVGVTWASNFDRTRRSLLTIFCVLIAGALAAATWVSAQPFYVATTIVFTVVYVVLGAKSCVGVIHDRRRIFGALGVSYAIGLLLGPYGVIILTVPSVLFANRNAIANGG